MTACKSNLKNIGIGLEKYAKDHENAYPEGLEALTPKYLEQIPICPAVEKDVYSASYQRTPDGQGYRVLCKGHNHESAHLEADYPAYDNVSGLVHRPGEPGSKSRKKKRRKKRRR